MKKGPLTSTRHRYRLLLEYDGPFFEQAFNDEQEFTDLLAQVSRRPYK